MRKRTILYILLFVTVLQTACIKEDMDNCPSPSHSLYFSYKGDGTREMFLEKERCVNLFVYDDNEAFVKEIVLNQYDLSKKQGVDLDLPQGKYKVVCWGNIDKNTQITGSSFLRDMSVGAPAYFNKERITTNDSLYYGTKEISITTNGYKVDTVNFKSAHTKMQIVLANLDQTAAQSDIVKLGSSDPVLSIEVGNLNPTISFDEVYSDEKASYYPSLIYNKDKKEAYTNLNVLRFKDQNDIYIHVRNSNTDEIVYTLSLMEFMKKYGISQERKNEVPMRIRFLFKGITIAVEPWDEEEITPGV